MTRHNWNLDDDEFGQPKRPNARTAYPHMEAANPVLVLVELIPLSARAIMLHIQVAIAVPLVLLAGNAMYYSRFLPEILVGSCPVGFLFGLWSYFVALKASREQRGSEGEETQASAASRPEPWIIIFCTVALPAVLFVGSVIVIWSHNRFIAAFFPALITFWVFAKWGGEPIKFYEQYLLSQFGMPLAARRQKALPEHRPDLRLLAVILMGVVAVPILFSNTIALFALTLGLAAYSFREMVGLWQMAPRGDALVYFLTFAYRICQRSVSYPEVMESERPLEDADTWAPPSTQMHRMFVFFVLLGSLYLALIVGLSYYCPWEFFAKLTTDYPDEAVISSGTTLQEYTWLFAPFMLLEYADPLALYLFCFVFAIAGCVLIPPAILLEPVSKPT